VRSGEKRLDRREHLQAGHSDFSLEAAGEAAITTVNKNVIKQCHGGHIF
jgi:hypothetical protein